MKLNEMNRQQLEELGDKVREFLLETLPDDTTNFIVLYVVGDGAGYGHHGHNVSRELARGMEHLADRIHFDIRNRN